MVIYVRLKTGTFVTKIAVKCNLLADKKPNLFSNLRTELL